MTETKILAVAGNPILHSLSPLIFNRAFQETGIDAVYTRLQAKNAGEAVDTARAIGMQGINVTSPLKKEMIPYCKTVEISSATIDAVNTIVAGNGDYSGFNTDHIGVVQALERNGVSPKNKRAAILGSGGAACAAAYGLKRAGAEKVVLINRTLRHAKNAARRLDCGYSPLGNIAETLKDSDILISCLPSKTGFFDPALLKKDLVVMDANYRESQVLSAAKEKGCRIISGLDWLLYQAIPAHRLFFGSDVSPELERRLSETLHAGIESVKRQVALIGFMGAGKTAVGQWLAEQMNLEFMDTDLLIEEAENLSVPLIFKQRGDDFFRKKEKYFLEKILSRSRSRVISLGGGGVLDSGNRSLLRRHCLVIWLWVTPETAVKRICPLSRPLLSVAESEKKAKAILKKRLPLYAKTSDMVINTETESARELALRIKNEMG